MPLLILNAIFLPVIGILASYSNKKSIIRLFFLFLFICFGIFRFDTTTDYSAYAQAFWEIKDGVYDGYFEVGYIYLNYLFAFSDYGYWLLLSTVYIFFVRAFISVTGRNIAVIAILFLILYGFNIRLDNIVRQAISMGIYLIGYSKRINGKNSSYYLLIFLAFLFHSSIIFVLALNFFYGLFKKIRSQISLTILVGFFLIFVGSNIIDYVVGIFMNYIEDPIYKGLLNLSLMERSIQPLMLLRTSIAYCILMYSFKKYGASFLTYHVFLACIGHFISGQFILLERVFEYYYLFEIVVLSYWMYFELYSARILILMSLLFTINTYINYNTFRWNEYKSIFTHDFVNHNFYVRNLSWQSDNWTINDFYNRSKIVKLR